MGLLDIIRDFFKHSNNNDTSISDAESNYHEAVKNAIHSDKAFKCFRKQKYIKGIYEIGDNSFANELIEIIESRSVFSKEMIHRFAGNDDVGGPEVFPYTILGEQVHLSVATLRYIKILSDLITLFDFDDIHNISEIGVGCGGQCRIILDYAGDNTVYNLFDLPDVLQLTKKYLGCFDGINQDNISYTDGTKAFDPVTCDLIISNYAFSELNRKVQDIYLNNVILPAKHGYMIWNDLAYKAYGAYSKDELLSLIPDSKELEEKPLTCENNCLIIW